MVIIRYRQSSQPVYKQKQIALSSMRWKCCPGYGGHNCLEKGNIACKYNQFQCHFYIDVYIQHVGSMHVALWPLSKENISWVAHSVLVTHLLLPPSFFFFFPDKPPEDETHALKSEINDNGSSGKSVVLGKAGFTFNLSFFCKVAFFKTTFLTNRGNIQTGLWLSECPSTGKGETDIHLIAGETVPYASTQKQQSCIRITTT